MNITVTAYAALVAANLPVPADATIVPDTALVSAPVTLDEAAVVVTPAQDTAPAQAQELPVLTRAAWKSLRMTRSGKVRKAFAGLTREQAHEAGLTPGYRLPTGEMRAVIREAKNA